MIARSQKEVRMNLLSYVLILSRWKRFLILNTLIWTAGAVVLVKVLPERYTAKTTLMPPKSNSEGLSKIMKSLPVAKLAGNAGSLLSGGGGSENLENIYLAILGSRSLQMEVIDSFNLAHVYKFDRKKDKKFFIEDLEKEFKKHIGVEVTEEGTFVIQAEDRDPVRAAAMANFMAAKLDQIFKGLTVETERNQRLFLEERLGLIKADLDSAERRFTQFQKDNKMLDIDEQAKATIDAGTTMEARYMAAELNLDINRRVFSGSNPKIKEAEMELSELRRQRDAMLHERKSDLLIPYKMAPELGLQLVRLKRNLKIQEALFELILGQYETAKFEEAKNTPTVQVLDKAFVPQKRTFPKRTKTVLALFALSGVFGIGLASFFEYFRRFKAERPEDYEKLRQIRKHFWGRYPIPN
jgi:tyrosine-protein kinase Etk/Wzc